MEKQFIPYEWALKLKELGFDEPCLGFYVPLLDGTQEFELLKFESQGKKVVLAPLWQQAFDWVREKYSIDSAVLPTFSTKYCYRLYEQQSKFKTQIYGDYIGKEYKTYEEAGLECLKKLIQLVE